MIAQPESGLRTIWIGHAGVLVEIDGVRLLIDPVTPRIGEVVTAGHSFVSTGWWEMIK